MKDHLIIFLFVVILSFSQNEMKEIDGYTSTRFKKLLHEENPVHNIIMIFYFGENCTMCENLLEMSNLIFNSNLNLNSDEEYWRNKGHIFGKILYNNDTKALFDLNRIFDFPALVLYRYNNLSKKYFKTIYSISPEMNMNIDKIIRILNAKLGINLKAPGKPFFNTFLSNLSIFLLLILGGLFLLYTFLNTKRIYLLFIIIFLVAVSGLPYNILNYNKDSIFLKQSKKGTALFSKNENENFLIEGSVVAVISLLASLAFLFLVNIGKIIKNIRFRLPLIIIVAFVLIIFIQRSTIVIDYGFALKNQWIRNASFIPPDYYIKGPMRNDQGYFI